MCFHAHQASSLAFCGPDVPEPPGQKTTQPSAEHGSAIREIVSSTGLKVAVIDQERAGAFVTSLVVLTKEWPKQDKAIPAAIVSRCAFHTAAAC